ncbi:MAG: hypothetical protein Kow00104_00360 [Rhodothalassiaceae bacterium]
MLARDYAPAYSNPTCLAELADDIHDYVIALRGLPGMREPCRRAAAAARLPELLLLFLPGAVEHGLAGCPPARAMRLVEVARSFDMRFAAPIARLCEAAQSRAAGSALHESLLTAEIEATRSLIHDLTGVAFEGLNLSEDTRRERTMAARHEAARALFHALPVAIPACACAGIVRIAFPLGD